MSKRARQYIGILAAVIAYYLVHEGAHLLYALFTGVFRQVNFMGLGVQVDVFRERMTDTQLGIFCLAGAAATFCMAYQDQECQVCQDAARRVSEQDLSLRLLQKRRWQNGV